MPLPKKQHLSKEESPQQSFRVNYRVFLILTKYRRFSEMSTTDEMFLTRPYDCVFSDYGNAPTQRRFNERNHIELANQYKNLKCKALMVIGRTPLTKNYRCYIVDEYGKSYAVNIRNRFKSEASHILISNYGNEAIKREPKLILEKNLFPMARIDSKVIFVTIHHGHLQR
jgi:site-specific DNA-adenine methylase